MKALACCWMIAVVGCGPSKDVYSYRIVNDNCDCEQFRLTDEKAKVTYSFSGDYSVFGF